MIDLNEYEKAVIVTGDGDFTCLVRYLQKQNKLHVLLAPDKNKCSTLLRQEIPNRISFLDSLANKLAIK